MADLNINVDYEYAPGEAGKTSYVTISDAKLTAMGYTPEAGKEKQALCVYNLNVGEGGASGGGSISDGLDSGILASVLDLTNTNPLTVAMVDANGDQVTSFGSTTTTPFTVTTNLNAVVADTEGASVDLTSYKNVTVHFKAVGTIDATVEIQHSLTGAADEWVTLDSNALTSAGMSEVGYPNVAYKYLRTVVTNYTSGTFTSTIYAGN